MAAYKVSRVLRQRPEQLFELAADVERYPEYLPWWVAARVRKGGVVFHHGNTLHTSGRNESDRWRRGYATHWVTSAVTCRINTLKKAYFNRPDYPAAHRRAAV